MRACLAVLALTASSCIVLVVQGGGVGDAGPTQEINLPDGGVGYLLPDGGITRSLVQAICQREPADGGPGTTVYFDASGSNPTPGSEITGYRWSFGDGQDAGGPLLSAVSHVYRDAGLYRAVLTVTDNTPASGSTTCPAVTISP